MNTKNNNENSSESAYPDFNIDEKDFRMWIFDRHNSEDSAIFDTVKVPDKNKIIELIPEEYTEIRDFISNSRAEELALELTENRRQHRKELEQEYIKEKINENVSPSHREKNTDTDDFDIKSENLRKTLKQAYENTDAKISFSSVDYSQIKKEVSNRQKRSTIIEEEATEEERAAYHLTKYKTANICLIILIFAMLAFFIGQRYVERNTENSLSLFYPAEESTVFSAFTDESDKTEAENSEEIAVNDESASSSENSTLININTASVAELQTLEGIGETKAMSIIAYRETYGKFSSTRDILKVNGIGEKTYEKIKNLITTE